MNKKALLILALLLTGLCAFSAVAQDYYDDAPRSRRGYGGWKSRMLTRGLSVNVGLWRAFEANVEGTEGTIKPEDPDYLFSFGAKLWFYRSNWGVGIDAVLLDAQKFSATESYEYWDGDSWETDFYATDYEMRRWLIDLDVYYRLPISRSIQLVGGAGFTFIKIKYDGDVGTLETDDSMNVGYNLKAGAEMFLSRDWSVSCMVTWHHFKEGGVNITTGVETIENTVKLLSATAQINWYL